MRKKRIAVIFGGRSAEYDVSLQSAVSVLENIDTKKFDIMPVGITRAGDWFHYTGAYDKISNNTWFESGAENVLPVAVSQNRSSKGFLTFSKNRCTLIEADLIFPVLHAKTARTGHCRDCLTWPGNTDCRLRYTILCSVYGQGQSTQTDKP